MIKGLSYWTAALALLVLSSGCASDPRNNRDTLYLGSGGQIVQKPTAENDNVSYWDGDGIQGKPSIKISLSEQRAYFYKDTQLVGVSLVSTGREGHDTPVGSYKIIQKDIELSKDPKPPGAIFDGAKMPNFMRIVGGTGVHAGFLPGYAASHGCIRMPMFMSENFFRNVSNGTPVTILP